MLPAFDEFSNELAMNCNKRLRPILSSPKNEKINGSFVFLRKFYDFTFENNSS